jgi:hypothetical protein
MADRMTTAERAAVADRIVSIPAAAVEKATVKDEDLLALRLLSLARAGDVGGIRRLVHEAEHRLGPWVVDPWRLAEAMAEVAARQHYS